MAEEKTKKKTAKAKKLEEFKKPNEEVEKIVEKIQGGKDVEDIEKQAEKKEEKTEEKKIDKEKKKEIKPELEREYVIPLRRKVQKVPRYKRAKKAIKVIREFIARHMKVEERNLRNVKIDKWLNQEIWFRGIKKPPAKIKVKASKIEGIVKVELVDIPEKVRFDIAKEEKLKKEVKKIKKVKVEKKEEKIEEEKKEEEEKEEAVVEAGLKRQESEAKKMKHTTGGEKFARQEQQFKRKAMKR